MMERMTMSIERSVNPSHIVHFRTFSLLSNSENLMSTYRRMSSFSAFMLSRNSPLNSSLNFPISSLSFPISSLISLLSLSKSSFIATLPSAASAIILMRSGCFVSSTATAVRNSRLLAISSSSSRETMHNPTLLFASNTY